MGGNERTGSACSSDGAVIVVVDVRRLDDGPCPCRVYKYECLVESTSPSDDDDDDDDDDTVGKDIVLMIRLHIHIFASKPAAATTT